MAHLIDKDAVLAEIESFREELQDKVETSDFIAGEVFIMNYFLSFLDTLEVKEVDLDTQIEDYINSHFTEGCDGGMISDWYKVLGGVHYKDLVEIAKHFFELGLKAQEECHYLTFKDAKKSIVNQARKELCNIKTQKGEKV